MSKGGWRCKDCHQEKLYSDYIKQSARGMEGLSSPSFPNCTDDEEAAPPVPRPAKMCLRGGGGRRHSNRLREVSPFRQNIGSGRQASNLPHPLADIQSIPPLLSDPTAGLPPFQLPERVPGNWREVTSREVLLAEMYFDAARSIEELGRMFAVPGDDEEPGYSTSRVVARAQLVLIMWCRYDCPRLEHHWRNREFCAIFSMGLDNDYDDNSDGHGNGNGRKGDNDNNSREGRSNSDNHGGGNGNDNGGEGSSSSAARHPPYNSNDNATARSPPDGENDDDDDFSDNDSIEEEARKVVRLARRICRKLDARLRTAGPQRERLIDAFRYARFPLGSMEKEVEDCENEEKAEGSGGGDQLKKAD